MCYHRHSPDSPKLPQEIAVMRALEALCLVILVTGMLTAADFPAPEKLPAQPGFPDPLVMLNGDKVTTKAEWNDKRRPELKALFEHYMYGKVPRTLRVEGKVVHEDDRAFHGKATLQEIAVSPTGPDWPAIHVLLVIPNKRKAPAPAFVGMNFTGNHSLVKDPGLLLPTSWMYPGRKGVKDNRATEEGRGTEIDTWALEQSIDRGYAVATFYNGDVDPDRKEERGKLYKKVVGLPRRDEQEGEKTATIMFWAWGISRVVDYLATRPEIDAKKIAVVGHSRLGKTALLAAAFDERIALAIPHQAGCGGTGPSRSANPKAESVERINTSFPHWFCDNFKAFNKSVEKLPFDQHCLVALCAPRPVLFTNAVGDQWANPPGQFDVLKAADPVYRLLGAGGLEAKEMPAENKLIDSTLGYYLRPGKHSMTKDDWKVFLDFADKHLRK
jgi:dienelactone hydrolase